MFYSLPLGYLQIKFDVADLSFLNSYIPFCVSRGFNQHPRDKCFLLRQEAIVVPFSTHAQFAGCQLHFSKNGNSQGQVTVTWVLWLLLKAKHLISSFPFAMRKQSRNVTAKSKGCVYLHLHMCIHT